jgi:hypothetical protein
VRFKKPSKNAWIVFGTSVEVRSSQANWKKYFAEWTSYRFWILAAQTKF